jgi:REP-associated tyrosine transposase
MLVSGLLWGMADQRGDGVRKGAHCAWQIHDHIVFPVQYRKALLDAAVAAIIQETAAEIVERFPIEMEAIGTDTNHIHVLCSAHPKVAPGRIVQIFKSLTAREIFRRKPAVKRELWGGEFRTDGYYVATVGERANWQMVERYVQQQGQPHDDLQQLQMF